MGNYFREEKKEPKNINMIDLIITLAVVVISLVAIYFGYVAFNSYSTESDGITVEKGKIIEILSVEEEKNYHGGNYYTETKTITFKAELTSGEDKGKIVEATQYKDSMYAMQDIDVEDGDTILLAVVDDLDTGGFKYAFSGYARAGKLLALTSVFLLFLIIIGRRQGITTIVSLGLICLAVFLVYIPAILAGVNIYLATSIVGIYIILMSLTIIGGANIKTLCAILGNIGGVVIAGAIAFFMNDILKMTGFIDDTYSLLMTTNTQEPLNLVALVWSGIVLGSMGAIMDVAMSISSAMNELGEHMKDRTFLKLVKSGMNIGKDAIGTMTNTLILAYMGGSLSLVILFMLNTKDLNFLFSLEVIVEQIIQSVVGSMGILFAVPFTAIFSAWLFNKRE